MRTGEIRETLEGMYYSLRVIETAMELGQQTTRLRNALDRTALDKMVANSVRALHGYNQVLEEKLADEE